MLPTDYRDGWQARLAGEPLDANPHDREAAPRAYLDWVDGWMDADYVRRARAVAELTAVEA
jgi:hypothetical protein